MCSSKAAGAWQTRRGRGIGERGLDALGALPGDDRLGHPADPGAERKMVGGRGFGCWRWPAARFRMSEKGWGFGGTGDWPFGWGLHIFGAGRYDGPAAPRNPGPLWQRRARRGYAR